MTTPNLNARQRELLIALDNLSTAGKPGAPSHTGWGGSYGTKGLAVIALTLDSRNPRGAGNTLAALRRRGLAENDGGGCFLQNRWRITQAGHELAETLRAQEPAPPPPTPANRRAGAANSPSGGPANLAGGEHQPKGRHEPHRIR